MHEAGIAHELIDLCETHLRLRGGKHATRVGVRVGALAGIDPEALRFCFAALKPGTALWSADLVIEWRSRFGCGCAHSPIALEAAPAVCPSCGAVESFDEVCA